MLTGSQKSQQLGALQKIMEHKPENTFIALHKTT